MTIGMTMTITRSMTVSGILSNGMTTLYTININSKSMTTTVACLLHAAFATTSTFDETFRTVHTRAL